MAARTGLAKTPRQHSRVRLILADAVTRTCTMAHLRRKGILTIPHAVRSALDLHEGDEFAVTIVDGVVVLIPADKVPKDGQAWYWSTAWQEGEAEADEDIERGRVTIYESSESFLASLGDD